MNEPINKLAPDCLGFMVHLKKLHTGKNGPHWSLLGTGETDWTV